MKNKTHIRFYAELNDCLPAEKRFQNFEYLFNGNPAVKDAIEALGIPHTEVDLILVNGQSVGFAYQLKNGDQVSVYPVFESFDISSRTRLREQPLRQSKFVADVHLGKLVRRLRLLGFDVLYENDYTDPQIVDISVQEHRIILTRDRGILKTGAVQHGYWIRSLNAEGQLKEVLDRFDLYSQIQPFKRCTVCNGLLKPVKKEAVLSHLLPKTKQHHQAFFQCEDCRKVYWKGSHYKKMTDYIFRLKKSNESNLSISK